MNKKGKSLTIGSVYYSKENLNLLKLNFYLTKKLNPTSDFCWLIVDNSPEGSQYKIKEEATNIKVIKGVKKINKLHAPGSYHHAAAINLSLEHVRTRFLLVLDCDFFIVWGNWINEILDHMQKNNLSFLGSVWHPAWYAKYRYFPSIHCFFIDLGKVDVKKLNFTPDIKDNIEVYDEALKRLSSKFAAYESRFIHSLETTGLNVLKNPLSTLLYSLHRTFGYSKAIFDMLTLRDRRLIGASRDTGYRIYKKFCQSNHKYETFTPVYRIPQFFRGPFYATTSLNRFLEKFLPEQLSFIPKKEGYFTEQGFKGKIYSKLGRYNFEEFMWQGQPFGFHVRGERNKGRGGENLKYVKKIVKSL